MPSATEAAQQKEPAAAALRTHEDAEAKLRRQADHFNSIADRYHEARQGQNHLLLKHLMWSAFFRRLPQLNGRPLDVLEPMCGYADGLDLLREHLGPDSVRSYRGFDYSDRVIETLRQERPGLDVWCADATAFDPEPDSADLIILLGGLHHVPDHAEGVVRRLAPALRRGGHFINLEPTYGNPLTRLVREGIYRRNDLFDEETERSFPVSRLRRMFTDAGLRPLEAQYPGLLAYVLYYNPDAFPLLNRGGPRAVRLAWSLDRPFLRNPLGRAASFATLAAWQRPE